METTQSEIVVPNELEYPIEYFDAQIEFAKKWSEVSGIALSDTLLQNTALL